MHALLQRLKPYRNRAVRFDPQSMHVPPLAYVSSHDTAMLLMLLFISAFPRAGSNA